MPALSLPINYNWLEVYVDGDQIEVTEGKSTIPQFVALKVEKELAGGKAMYSSKRFDTSEGTMVAMMPTSDAIIKSFQFNKIQRLSIQAAFQEEDLITGNMTDSVITWDMDVTFFGNEEHSIEPNANGEFNMPYEAKSIRISINGVAIVNIDKRTGSFVVNNEDLAQAMRIAYGQI